MKFTNEQEVIDGRAVSRSWDVSKRILQLGRDLYTARALWIGEGALPWDELTPGQRHNYRKEAESLVKSCGFTPQVRPTFEGRTEQLRSGLALLPADPRD